VSTADFMAGRIEATKRAIIAYEDAIEALGVAGGVESYTLDTGQSVQKVTRTNLKELNELLSSLYNRLATMCARENGSAAIVRPAF